MAEEIKSGGNAFIEDDEFEDFDVEDWKSDEEEPDNVKLWEDNWDDDDVDDDFSMQLRAELDKVPKFTKNQVPKPTTQS